MTLDDQLNPNDGSFIDRIDSALFEFNKKIAEKWQDKTYMSKEVLARNFHGLSATTFIYDSINYFKDSSLFYVIPLSIGVVEAVKFVSGFKTVSTGLERDIGYEAIGLPTKTGKYFDVGLYLAGAFYTTVALGGLTYDLIARDMNHLPESLDLLTFGLAYISWKTGDYLDRVDVGGPPKKPKKKSVYERVKEGIGSLIPKKVYG